MGGNQSSVVNEAVNETVRSVIMDQNNIVKQSIMHTSKEVVSFTIKAGRDINMDGCIISNEYGSAHVEKIDINTNVSVTSDQVDQFTEELKTSLKNKIEQEIKGLAMGENKDKLENYITNITRSQIESKLQTSIDKSVKDTFELNAKFSFEAGRDINCKNGKIIGKVTLSRDEAISDITQSVSNQIQDISEIVKIQDMVDNEVKQKNIGLDLTMVLIVAVICAMIYFMAESGTLGQLGSVFKGGKSSGGGGGIEMTSLKRSPVISRASLLSKAAPVLKEAAMFGAFGKSKAWWTAL